MSNRMYDLDEYPNKAPGSDPHYQSIARSMIALQRGNHMESVVQIERAIDVFSDNP